MNRAEEHVRDIARKRAAVIRLESELDIVKANVKTAKLELEHALIDASFYAEGQLAFELK